MHIAINCRSFSKRQCTGIGRYASNLVRSLAQIDRDNTYSLYATRGLRQIHRRVPLEKTAGNFSVRMDWFKRGVDKTLPSADIYHAPSPEVIETRRAKVVVTVHDLIYKTFPESHTPQTIALTEKQFQSFIPMASKIICSSEHTREDLHKYFTLDRNKTCAIPQGVDRKVFYPFDEETKKTVRREMRFQGIKDPFILFVGTLEPRKNLKGLLEAFSELKRRKIFLGKLLVVGMMGWKSEETPALLDRLGIREDVIFPGFVCDDAVCRFYNTAEIFVFPSFYEGFGYPILEAFSCGAAVVTSRTSSCGELAGEAALLVEPSDIEGIAGAMARMIEDKGLREDLRRKALTRAGEFDNLKTARETLKIYEEVYGL